MKTHPNLFKFCLLVIALGFFIPFVWAQEKTVIWSKTTKAPMVASPVISHGLVFVGGLDSILYAFDLNSGKDVWKYRTGNTIRSNVLIADQKLFLNGDDGKLYCLDPANGQIIWVFNSFNGYMGDGNQDFADYYASTPVLFQNLILYGSGNCFYAVDLKSGSLKWWFKAEGAVHTKPAIASNIVYFGSFGGYVYALDAITGRAIWEFKTTGHTYFPAGEVTGNPVVLDGKVFVGARDYNFYALDAQGGYCHWLQQFPRGWALPVTIADSVVLLGTSDDRALLALDPASGNERWRINTGFNVFGACAVANGVGYVGTLAGRLIAFDVKSGKTHWEFETGARQRNHNKFLTNGDAYRDDIGALLKSSSDVLRMYQALGGIFSTPVISDDKLVVSCYDGSVYCLRLH